MVSRSEPSTNFPHIYLILEEALTCPQRGLVPAIKYSDEHLKDEIITESAIVAQFLADKFPSHLLPASNGSPKAALERARINFFIDTWNTKIGSFMFAIFRASTDEEKEVKSKEWVAAVAKDIEPQLKTANPFFGGSSELTLAEVCSRLHMVENVWNMLLIRMSRSILRRSCCASMRSPAVDYSLRQSRQA